MNIERWLRVKSKRALHKLGDWLFGPPFDKAWVEEEVIDDICVLAKSATPKEMIAFLTGEIKKEKTKQGKMRVLVINGLYIKGYYASRNSTSFTLHDLPLLDVYGTVHNHPSGNNRPSGADKRLFGKHGWFHMIIGAPYTRENIAFYDKYGERLDKP